MELGYFDEFPHRKGRSAADDFAESLALAEAAERWGMDAVWLAELHCAPERSVLAAPLTVASALAARTERIKIGTAVQVLPLADPFRLAEETATVDQMSRGRLIFGVGRSSSPRVYQAYGIPYAESRDRFTEALEIILRAWTEPAFSYRGRYYHYENIGLVPKPYQQPHPPLRVAINSPDSFVSLGTLGYPIFVAVRLGTFATLGPNVQAYRDARRAAGHPGEGQVFLRVPIYIGDTPEAAREEPRESVMRMFSEGGLLDSLATGIQDYDAVLEGKVIVGTVDQVTQRLQELQRELGLDGVLAELNCGGLIPPERVRRSMQLLCEEVRPALAERADEDSSKTSARLSS